MLPVRSVIDYSLARRALLADLYAGRASVVDVCDAHPYLQRAAKYHGEPTTDTCPVCRKGPLTLVTYTYGDSFPSAANGRARASAELAQLAKEHAEFSVYVVEVCRGCDWNHLRTSYIVGSGRSVARRSRRTSRAAEE